MTAQAPKIHIIEFERARLPRFASFLDVAATILDVPEDVAEWFWRFTICAGRHADSPSAVVRRHSHALLAALPSSVTSIADELRRRFPGCEPAHILDERRLSLQQIIELAGEREICHWYGDDSESKS